ncbi:hypothetical protein VNO80_02824 [Phaseolus coccineus]|uniref:Uncharacterized protein n=1 Tax=Phaseolus coccineus TaxID=3886 RepID=A0AAN9NQD4_PHACN
MEACWCFVCVGCFLAFVSAYAACTFVVEVEEVGERQLLKSFGSISWETLFSAVSLWKLGFCEMEAEDGTSNGDNIEWAVLDRRPDSEDGDYVGRTQGGNNVAGGEEGQGLKNETINDGVVVEGEEVLGLKKEAVDSWVTSKSGNGIAEGEEVRGLKREAVNNGVTREGGNGVANRQEVWGLKNVTVITGLSVEGGNGVVAGEERVKDLKNETVNNGMVLEGENGVAEGEVWALKNDVVNIRVEVADGNGVSEVGEVLGSKKEIINNGAAIADGNLVAYSGGLGSKNEAVNNEMVITDGNGVTAVEDGHLKNGTVDNVVICADGFGVVEGNSGAVECFRTYKRRKHVKSTSEFKVQENRRIHLEAVSHPLDQVFPTAFTTCVPLMVLYIYFVITLAVIVSLAAS